MRGFVVADFLDALTNQFLLVGVLVTAGLTVAGLAGGLILGMVVALLRSSGSAPVSRLAQGYIWFFRGTPLLIQMVMVYSGLPQLGIKFGVLVSVIVTLVLNEAAYMAEIIRGGFLAVPAGQSDAAKALGNSVNGLLKATSIASVISMEELMRRSEMIMQVKFDVLEVFAAAAVYYLVLTTVWDRVQRRLERRFDPMGRSSSDKKAIVPAIEQAALPR